MSRGKQSSRNQNYLIFYSATLVCLVKYFCGVQGLPGAGVQGWRVSISGLDIRQCSPQSGSHLISPRCLPADTIVLSPFSIATHRPAPRDNWRELPSLPYCDHRDLRDMWSEWSQNKWNLRVGRTCVSVASSVEWIVSTQWQIYPTTSWIFFTECLKYFCTIIYTNQPWLFPGHHQVTPDPELMNNKTKIRNKPQVQDRYGNIL